ncbi:hypothetical protein [Spirosoma sordidisoli]|uniref:Uncharacterized protein n=1 Tax=Spirosoma sordidisoli TaxID=2502893 RepID=A0A4Q2UFQ0_9BACT|nr:hypothetical protein [Spirosoma sordidisoli]RYC68153.1 hypothetical protein EQG79_22140 [Spirosoma sordidisoli]
MSDIHYVSDLTGKTLFVQVPVEKYLRLVAADEELRTLQQKGGSAAVSKAYSLDEIRQVHAAAYSPWTTDEESRLKILFFEGKTIKAIAETLGRKEGAITSRLNKLGIDHTK